MTTFTTFIEEQMRKYWYHAGHWHNAECNFLISDAGVCNCDVDKNRKDVKSLTTTAHGAVEAFAEEMMRGIGENDTKKCDFYDEIGMGKHIGTHDERARIRSILSDLLHKNIPSNTVRTGDEGLVKKTQ